MSSFDRFWTGKLKAGRPTRALPIAAIEEMSGGAFAVKRAMDLVIAALLLIALLLPMILIAALVRLTSPGPAIFQQERVGRRGTLFTAYKFRTMYVGAELEVEKLKPLNEAAAPLFKIRNDPRLTPVGRLLRRTSCDELPQLWNVLRGDMSLVGPRPALPIEVLHYTEWHMKRLQVSQGATGLWQVSGRSELTFEEMVQLDLYYIEHWSPWLDLKILLRTIPAMLTGRGAY